MALGIFENHLAYLVLFLASSVVAIIPITIGGVGAREMTFLLATPYFSIDTNTAVIFSLIFFIITAISSFFGAFVKLESTHKFESSFKWATYIKHIQLSLTNTKDITNVPNWEICFHFETVFRSLFLPGAAFKKNIQNLKKN